MENQNIKDTLETLVTQLKGSADRIKESLFRGPGAAVGGPELVARATLMGEIMNALISQVNVGMHDPDNIKAHVEIAKRYFDEAWKIVSARETQSKETPSEEMM